jgi:hypothetical protein
MLYQSFRVALIILILMSTNTVFSQSMEADSVFQQFDRYWKMQPGLYRVMKDGRVGVTDDKGNIIVPCQFDQVWTPTENQFIRVLTNMQTGLYHTEKGIILPPEYDQIWPFENGLAKIMKDRKYGYINIEGRMIIPCEYQNIWAPQNNRIKVITDGLTGFLNTQGETIAPTIYQHIGAYKNQRALVVRDGKMGYIDESGNEVVPAIYDHVWPFENDKARVMMDGNYFMINKQGIILYSIKDNDPNQVYIDETEKKQSQVIHLGKDYIDIRSDGKNVHIKNKNKSWFKFRDKEGSFGLAFNGYLNENHGEELPDDYDFMELNQVKSLEVAIYPLQRNVALLGNWFGLSGGLGLKYNNYRFNFETPEDINPAGREWFPTINEKTQITKSKLMILHASAPLMAEIQIFDRQTHNVFTLSGGVVGEIRLKSHTKLVTQNEDGRQKIKRRGDMGIANFRYGYMARIGIDDFSLYASYYPNSLFKTIEGPELYPVSVGVMFLLD